MTALTDAVKDEIQTAYRTWLAARDFKPRRGQRQMIAQIARSLSADEDRIAVVEAGTGTGKTAAYCLAAIPLCLLYTSPSPRDTPISRMPSSA